MSIHSGHRQRLKNRFREEGLDNFSSINALELLLFYCVPRKDTNPIAHKLLEHFGSFASVLEATAEELEKVPDVGPNISTFLNLIAQTARYYQVKSQEGAKILQTIDDCGKYLQAHFVGRRNEMVYLLCLDAKCKVICCREIGEGSVNSAGISIRRVVEVALGVNATSVILAHNHPSGIALPSHEDVSATIQLAKALHAVDVVLTDHIVVAEDDFISMVLSGIYRPNEIFNEV